MCRSSILWFLQHQVFRDVAPPELSEQRKTNNQAVLHLDDVTMVLMVLILRDYKAAFLWLLMGTLYSWSIISFIRGRQLIKMCETQQVPKGNLERLMRQRAHTFKENKGLHRQTADVVCFFIDVNQSKHSNHVILASYSKCISSKIIDDFAFKQREGPKGKQGGEKNPSQSKKYSWSENQSSGRRKRTQVK